MKPASIAVRIFNNNNNNHDIHNWHIQAEAGVLIGLC